MARRYQVFISATSDLKADREEAHKAVRACECDPCAMEDWTSSDAELEREIERKLSGCDFMVLLVGESLGSKVPDRDRSWVQHEFDRAREMGIPIIPLVKILPDETKLAEGQKDFRNELRRTMVTKGYKDESELAGYLSASLLAMIRPKEQALVLETNADLIAEVADYLNERKRRSAGADPPRAVLIQYSAQNARDIIRKLLWNGVETDLYIIDPECEYVLNDHQRAWIRQNVRQLPNHVDPLQGPPVLPKLRIFRYKAPGSLRVVQIDDEFLAIGGFAFLVKHPVPDQPPQLDVRGGELPMVLFRKRHAGFGMMERMVSSMLDNWKAHGVVPAEPEVLLG